MIFVILIIVAIVAWKIIDAPDSETTKRFLKMKTRTEEQKKVLRYFCNDAGCLYDHRMSDNDYEAIVKKYLNEDHRGRALAKIGLDEDELKEVAPICLHNYCFKPLDKYFARCGGDGKWRSSGYQITWLFFSSTQVFFYQETKSFDCDERRVSTEELYFKDITSFAASTEVEEVVDNSVKVKGNEPQPRMNIETSQFRITVPGDKFFAAMETTPEIERAIQGLKNKLREMKNA